MDLSKQQALDIHLKAIHSVNFSGNLSWDWNKPMFFIIEEGIETVLNFSQGIVKLL